MPIYEYQCAQCHGRFQRLVRGFVDPTDLACPRCATTAVTRIMSQVAHIRSESTHADALLSDTSMTGIDENDPRAVARWAKQLGTRMGDEAGADWNNMVDQMVEEEFSQDTPSTQSSDDLGWA